MEQIPAEVARKILNRDFSNLVSRVQSGGKLTRGERAMLAISLLLVVVVLSGLLVGHQPAVSEPSPPPEVREAP